MRRPDIPRGSDRGETLVEVLVAVAILGVAGVAVVAGLQMSVTSSDIHRKETTGGAYVRSLAEAIEEYVAAPSTTRYQPCAAADAYKVGAVTSRLALPAGYSATQAAATNVGQPTCTTDDGVQQLKLTVATPDHRGDETLYLVLRKPCDPSVAPCTS